MNWGDVPAWAAFVLSGVAVWVSVKARGDGKKSADASATSAQASVRSAVAAEGALALQRQEFNERRAAEAEASRPRVDLRIEYVGGDRYRVVNHGEAPAENVRFVQPPEQAHGLNEVLSLARNEGHDFYVLGSAGLDIPTSLKAVWDGQTEAVTLRMPPV
ncbi:hypothetical protein OG824_31690 [Streptomyces prunicolor]|uniref:hypothetical protein n=1 Tax=Streptomyces prunicolor TaxID=67348 RepID=UPI002258C210|nr:hypothetical protein [Streptomyces prunicolor]MCX5239773.1 hypothetical protein [Streptomyces prunicolor]